MMDNVGLSYHHCYIRIIYGMCVSDSTREGVETVSVLCLAMLCGVLPVRQFTVEGVSAWLERGLSS